MIRCCICDDKREDLAQLRACAGAFSEKHPEYPLEVATYLSSSALLDAVQRQGGYDIYLLDVVMPAPNGIALARKLRERGERAEILFLTVSREYGVDAFGVQASGYLVKPFQQEEFDKAMHLCLQRLAPAESPAIFLKTREGVRKVRVRDILLVESFNHRRACTLCDGDVLETGATLTELHAQLQSFAGFVQPHRAYIVNLDYVVSLNATGIVLTDGRRVPVARSAYQKVKDAYIDYAFLKL